MSNNKEEQKRCINKQKAQRKAPWKCVEPNNLIVSTNKKDKYLAYTFSDSNVHFHENITAYLFIDCESYHIRDMRTRDKYVRIVSYGMMR